MGWWMAIPAIISAGSAIYNKYQGDQAAGSTAAWNVYNAHSQYKVTLNNLYTQGALSMFNAAGVMGSAKVQAEATRGTAKLNANILRETQRYNDSLLAEEEALLWEKTGLDLDMLHDRRRAERSTMEAKQSASGTLMGDGSNKVAIEDQMMQEELDAFVIQHGADIQAAKITNARAQGKWETEMQIKKIIFEGEMGAMVAESNAGAQAASIMAEGVLNNLAGLTTANYQLEAGIYGSKHQFNADIAKSNNAFTNGMFSAASTAASSYYDYKSNIAGSEAGKSLVAS